jgi:exodeoxyribonuclease V beta subunit
MFESKGVYSMFQLVLKTYNVRGNLLKANQKNGQRLLTNLLHLVELLQHQQSRFKMSVEEMIEWLKRAKEEGMNGENSFEQRLESDENAVNIVTVHKAKGLAYNIVFTPFLESAPKTKFISKYKQDDKYFISLDFNNNEVAAQAFATQYEQEERRIVYVALTRAVYYCGIYTKPNSKNTLGHFTNTWLGSKEDVCQFEPDPNISYQNTVAQSLPEPNALPERLLFDKQWAVLSYSGIVSRGIHAATNNVENPSTYAFEKFIFEKMPKGTLFGSFVHEIFEQIDFADTANWEKIIRKTGQKLLGWSNPLSESQMADMPFYMQWFQYICKTRLSTAGGDFSLSEIDKKLPELEFYFPYDQIDSAGIKNVLQTVDIETKDELNIAGMMNGFIDLVFEHKGKYYILDWKTNYLGNSLEAYHSDGLEQAMNHHNYHLQYLIYTVALCRYLQTRIPNFDYEKHFGGVIYMFVRGVREGKNTGIYFNRFDLPIYQSVENCFGFNREIA